MVRTLLVKSPDSPCPLTGRLDPLEEFGTTPDPGVAIKFYFQIELSGISVVQQTAFRARKRVLWRSLPQGLNKSNQLWK